MKLPAFQFYPGDWTKDAKLRSCSHTAKGAWVDLLCLMFDCDERGVLTTNGRPWSDEDAARSVGCDVSVIQELTLKGVAKRNAEGALYSSRMVTDEHKRKLCSDAGKRGGNPNLTPTLKGVPKGDARVPVKPKPTPSSSSSSSDINQGPIAEEIYEAYPKKVGRQDALKAISKVLAGNAVSGFPDPARILSQTKAYAVAVSSWPESDQKFIPHPATWFNRGSYDDDPSTWERKGAEPANPRYEIPLSYS